MNEYVDLHTHTHASDGMMTPRTNVRLAKEAGLTALAITDHDTVAGIDEAITAGMEYDLNIVPGVEISTSLQGQEIHVLGYYVDHNDPRFLSRLQQLRNVRETRNEQMIEKLNQLGLSIDMDEVLEYMNRERSSDESVGRPHMAAVLIAKGFVKSMDEAFRLYLGSGGKAYVHVSRILPHEAIAWIREAGGTAVLAHPGIYHNDLLVEEIIAGGLDGMEVYHSDHTPSDVIRYESLAEKHHLIVTAGSDFHGEREGIVFHGAIGSQKTDIAVLASLQKNKRVDKHQ